LDVENHPWFLGVFLHRPYQQILRDVVEEALDVQIDDPVIAPASLPRLPHRLQGPLPRSIPVGIRMEQRVHRRLQSRLHHPLPDPIRHRRYAQLPFPAVGFRYLHRPHRRRKVTARRHPIPDLVQVPFQVPFEIRNRLLVDPCRSLVGFDSLIRFPDFPLGNTERLGLTPRLLPFLGGSLNQAPQHHPFAPSRFRDFFATTGCSVPELRFRTLALVVLPLAASPFASESQVPTFRSTASRQAQATLMPGAASVRKQAPPKLLPR